MKRYRILGTPCLNIESINDCKDFILELIKNERGGYSTAINAEKILLYSKDSKMRGIIDRSVLPVPDGSGAVLGLKLLHQVKSVRLDLPKIILEIANSKGLKLFVLGATEENNKRAVLEIEKRYPDIELVGRQNGFFENEEQIFETLNKKEPQLVLVALGSPKQERFAARINESLPNILFIGCGGALDILAGKVKRAPKFFQDNHLEWFYRLASEPKRIKRQKRLPLFFFKLLKETAQQKLKK